MCSSLMEYDFSKNSFMEVFSDEETNDRIVLVFATATLPLSRELARISLNFS